MGLDIDASLRQVDIVKSRFPYWSTVVMQVSDSGRVYPSSATSTTGYKETLTPAPEDFIRKKIIVAQRIEDFYWRHSTHCVGNIRKGTKAKQIFTQEGQLIVMTLAYIFVL